MATFLVGGLQSTTGAFLEPARVPEFSAEVYALERLIRPNGSGLALNFVLGMSAAAFELQNRFWLF